MGEKWLTREEGWRGATGAVERGEEGDRREGTSMEKGKGDAGVLKRVG